MDHRWGIVDIPGNHNRSNGIKAVRSSLYPPLDREQRAFPCSPVTSRSSQPEKYFYPRASSRMCP